MMGRMKRLKDPIYGYIDIPAGYMSDIIDTAVFQRLRRIIQTSYSPLYSSAVHNRFVHSLGVYHLGEMAFSFLHKVMQKKCGFDIPEDRCVRLGEVFVLACLLHDVGHAPFSHTGEAFYLNPPGDFCYLHNQLEKAVNSKTFHVPEEKSDAAAPHEIMSAIIGLKTYTKYFHDEEEREFFARCITGYTYAPANNVTLS